MKRVVLSILVGALALTFTAAGPVFSAEEDFGGPEITFTAPAPGVIFSHKTHVGDFGYDCAACHDGLFEMSSLSAQEQGDFTMASLAKGKYCGSCHDGKTAFISSSQCSSCHQSGGDVIYTQPVQGVLFSHQAHVEGVGLDCESCHTGQFEMKALKVQEKADFVMEALYKGKYCGACHDGSMAFASNTRCASCHVGVKGLLRATAGKAGQKKGH